MRIAYGNSVNVPVEKNSTRGTFPLTPAAHGSQVTALPAHLCRHINCWKISLSVVDRQFLLCSIDVTTESRELLWWVVVKKIVCFRGGVRV